MMLFCCFADGQITSLDAFNLNLQFVLYIYHFRVKSDSDQTPPGVKALREMALASAKKNIPLSYLFILTLSQMLNSQRRDFHQLNLRDGGIASHVNSGWCWVMLLIWVR